MKQKSLFFVFAVVLFILQGCSTSQETTSGFHPSDNNTSTSTPLHDQEVTLQIESRLEAGFNSSYRFLGFIGEDTLVFLSSNFEYQMFQPAKVGHSFTFRYLGEGMENQTVSAEIIEFSRDEGYVKLKINVEEQ